MTLEQDLLKEIILIDDGSNYEYLGSVLEEYLNILTDKVQLLRNGRRQGLIKSRMNGFEASSGEIITFLGITKRWDTDFCTYIYSYL